MRDVGETATAEQRTERDGRVVAFCSAGCRAKFVADPDAYLDGPQANEPGGAARGATYTCPMHPQIRRNVPGSCPICGMGLEPLTVTAEVQPNAELADMTRRLWILKWATTFRRSACTVLNRRP